MLTTLMLTIVCAGCPEPPVAPTTPQEAAISQAVLKQSSSEAQKVADFRVMQAVAPIKTQGLEIRRSAIPSILRVSEETAKDVPTGMAAIYLESTRPVLDDREARTLDSMLTALRLSVDPQAVEKLKNSPRAFKVSTVRNDDAVDPKDEAQQCIYASIQSSMIGI